jgi:hypothetical protein
MGRISMGAFQHLLLTAVTFQASLNFMVISSRCSH